MSGFSGAALADIVITGAGIVSSVGATGPITVNSIRSNISRMQEVSIRARGKQPLVGAPVTMVDSKSVHRDRLWTFAAHAAREALESADPATPLDRSLCSVYFVTPEPSRPGYAASVQDAARIQFQKEMGLPESQGRWIEVSAGHAGAVAAIASAVQELHTGSASACMIGGVDTLIQLRTLRCLQDADRLKTEANTDGVIPGEGAAFVVLETAAAAHRRRATVLAAVRAVGSAFEHATPFNGEPCRAEALTEAVRGATQAAGVEVGNIDEVVCDLNGESHRAFEWGLACTRLGFTDHTEITHPADCLGDTGACTGAVLLAFAAMDLPTRADGHTMLIFAGSDSGLRAAAVLTGRGGATEVRAASPPGASTDLIEEHLEELAFLWNLRRRAARSPDYTHAGLCRIDRRIQSHIQGIALAGAGGVAYARQYLTSDDALACFAAADVMLRHGSDDDRRLVLANYLDQNHTAPESLREALLSSFPAVLANQLREATAAEEDPVRSARALEILASHGIDVPVRLVWPLVNESNVECRRAAWAVIGRANLVATRALYESGLSDNDAFVRRQVVLAAVGTRQSWLLDYSRSWATAAGIGEGSPAFWLAVLGEPSDSSQLLRLIEESQRQGPAVLLLPAFGYPDVVPVLLRLMDSGDLETAVHAGLAFTRMTGLQIESDQRVEIVPENAAPDEFALEFADDYWLPDAKKARAAWEDMRTQFPAAQRIRAGLSVRDSQFAVLERKLDCEGRWHAAMRAMYYGVWRGPISDLLAFPQKG